MLEIKELGVKLGSFSLENVSLKLEKGDYLTVLGLSGAGKTVLLELIAGLIKPHKGTVWLHNKNITQSSIQKRPIGLVYQDMALFPHMSVKKNITYPLRSQKLTRDEKQRILNNLARECKVDHLLNRYPGTLSGGEAQRVALARTLASEPEVLLLDEPLASLDVKLRQELRDLLKQINQKGKTIIHVTHDYMEAATLSKNLAIIENGKLIQWGRPAEVFRNPVSEFVARFSGIKNIFPCTFKEHETNNGLYIGYTPKGEEIRLLNKPSTKESFVMIPGEDIIISESKLETSAINQYQARIKEIFTLNYGVEIMAEAREQFSIVITRRSLDKLHLEPGKDIWINFKASAVKLL